MRDAEQRWCRDHDVKAQEEGRNSPRDLLKQDAELHAKIAIAASGLVASVIREAAAASLGRIEPRSAPNKPAKPKAHDVGDGPGSHCCRLLLRSHYEVTP